MTNDLTILIITAGAFLLILAAIVGGVVQPPVADPTHSAEGETQRTTLAFEDVSSEADLMYETDAREDGAMDMISAVGIYAADVDKDGWTDLLAVGGDHPVLFENDRGEFQRSDALPQLDRTIRSAVFLDYDADGWEDLLLLSDDREPLLLENDRGTFVRADVGIDQELGVPAGATTADYDRDGCIDLFIIQNGRWDEKAPIGLNSASVPLDDDNALPNVLFKGTCSGFERVDDAAIRGTRWSLATSFVDLTGDGWADIHVANDFNRDVLYVNQRNGSFERIVLPNVTDRNGMSSEIADVTGDGRPDVFTTNIYHPRIVKETVPTGQKVRANGNTLLVNQGNGSFVDRAEEYRVQRGGWGWAAIIEDFDNDGNVDLFHATRRMQLLTPFSTLEREDIEMLENRYPAYWYPLIARGMDEGFSRRNASRVGFAKTDGRGAATLDFDRDGKLDLVVANADGEFKLYRNVGETGSSLQITLDGEGDTVPDGATVSVTAGGETMTQWYASNTDFLSQSSRTLHFGTGAHDRVDVAVEWPDGTTRTIEDVSVDQRLVLTPDEVRRIELG